MKAISVRAGVVAAIVCTLAMVIGIAGPASAAPPVPLTNIDCTKLSSAVNPQASFASGIAQRNPADSDAIYGQVLQGIPYTSQLRMAGGLVCEYSNGRNIYNMASGAVGMRVQFLPGAAAGYWAWAASVGVTTPQYFTCIPIPDLPCQLQSSAGGDYLYIQTEGTANPVVALRLVAAVRNALLLTQRAAYGAPTYATPLVTNCEQLVTPTDWQHAVGSPVRLRTDPGLPGESDVEYAMNRIHAFLCFYTDGSYHAAGWMESMPGGRWAFLAASRFLTTPGALTAITAPGMRSGDTAYTRCDPGHTHCILDALIATHWIQIDLKPTPAPGGGELIRTDRLAALRTLLAEVVQHVYAP